VWCVGNEMDGPWQIGAPNAVEYGRKAAEAGKVMRLIDPSIELVVCGSSNTSMPTFGAWEETVLDLAWDIADHISLHTYYDPESFETVDDFLGCSRDLDAMIDTVAATADAVAGRKRSAKRIGLSVDEWNVWYQTSNSHQRGGEVPFERAPAIAEDTYTLADALVVGCLLITLLRHADRVRMACVAQLVNVIPPIRTVDGGPAWRQTTFFPFMHAARFGRGTVLRVEPDPPSDALEVTATLDPGSGERTVFAVNRGAEPLALDIVLRDAARGELVEHLVLTGDLGATNTADAPDTIAPRAVDGAELPPRSWNVLRLT
jgi:alpha-L-arabinofuranosidase